MAIFDELEIGGDNCRGVIQFKHHGARLRKYHVGDLLITQSTKDSTYLPGILGDGGSLYRYFSIEIQSGRIVTVREISEGEYNKLLEETEF